MEIIPEKIVDVNKDIENHQIGCIYDKALAKLKIKLGDLAIHSKSMSLIIKYVLEIIEATPIKGSKQKDMALKLMRAVNPLVIPRNQIVEEALTAANNNNLDSLVKLNKILSKPYINQDGIEDYQNVTNTNYKDYKTFCGT